MYEANGVKFASFSAAIKAAEATGANVYLILADGSKASRWSPIPKADPKTAAKRTLRYLGQKNAYEAQQRMMEQK